MWSPGGSVQAIGDLSPTLIFNVALLVLSSLGTLAAFGGKTWVDDDRPLLRRITRRGWVSLTCLTLALSVGVGKNLYDGKQAERRAGNEATNDQRVKDMQSSVAQAAKDLAAAKLEAAEQTQASKDLRALAEQQKATLDAQNVSLAKANSLILSSYELSKERIDDVSLLVLLNDRAIDGVDWTFSVEDRDVRDLADIVTPGASALERGLLRVDLVHHFGRVFLLDTYDANGTPVTAPSREDRPWFSGSREKGRTISTLSARPHAPSSQPALMAYRDFMVHGASFTVRVKLEKDFPSAAALARFVADHPQLERFQSEGDPPLKARFRLPPALIASSRKALSGLEPQLTLTIAPKRDAASTFVQIIDGAEKPSFEFDRASFQARFQARRDTRIELGGPAP